MSNNGKPKNVTDIVVNNELCIGCGVCAGLCPSNYLEVVWSEKGELVPRSTGCVSTCSLCLDVCPSYLSNRANIGPIDRTSEKQGLWRYHPYVGRYLQTYAGFTTDLSQRLKSASGGMAGWLAKELLRNNFVDRIVCVAESNRTDRLFDFTIIDNPAGIDRTLSTKYYPVDISQVIKIIMQEKQDFRYAVLGIPCLITGLHKAMTKIPKLRRRIKFLLGMVCGQLPNRHYTEYLGTKSGVKPESLARVSYRIKENTTKANDFFFRAYDKNGNQGKPLLFSDDPSRLWLNGYFVHNACHFCEDAFSEVSNITFMDAWLPKYQNDPTGHSLIIVRSQELDAILTSGNSIGTCNIEPVSVDDVIKSQPRVVYRKKTLIRGWLWYAKARNKWVPNKRTTASAQIFIKHFASILLEDMVMRKSKRLWPQMGKDKDKYDRQFLFLDHILKGIRYLERKMSK